MATGITPVICPQCHSNNVRMESETRGVCESCGTALIIEEKGDERDVRIENEEESEFDTRFELIPEYGKERFLKEAWTALAKEDAPLEVFGRDFESVTEKVHQVLSDSVNADVSYRASIGYDRQEPYTAYEDTLETETYYENGQRYTRRVVRQRPVTKYKTVTDWHPFQSEKNLDSLVTVDNTDGLYFDEDLFTEALIHASAESFSYLSAEKTVGIKTTDRAQREITKKHGDEMMRKVVSSLPGDRYKDLELKLVSLNKSSTGLYLAHEYEAAVSYKGKKYVKRAFPFGFMKIGGDVIENDGGFEATAGSMRKEIPSRVWCKTKTNSYLTAAMLALSLFASLFVHVRFPVVALFISAVAAFTYNAVKVSRVKRSETGKVEAEITKSSGKHKEKLCRALNAKLAALGFGPVSPDAL